MSSPKYNCYDTERGTSGQKHFFVCLLTNIWFFFQFHFINWQNPKRINHVCKIFFLLVHHIFLCKASKNVILQAFLFFVFMHFSPFSKTILMVIWLVCVVTKTHRTHECDSLSLFCLVLWLFPLPPTKPSLFSFQRTGTVWIWVRFAST